MLEVEAEAVPRDMSTGPGDMEVPMGRGIGQLCGGWDQGFDREDLWRLVPTSLKWPGMPSCSTMGGISSLELLNLEFAVINAVISNTLQGRNPVRKRALQKMRTLPCQSKGRCQGNKCIKGVI